MDLIYIAGIVAFTAFSVALVVGFERLHDRIWGGRP